MKSFFLISILITAIIFGGLSFNQAFAHQDAPGVSAPGVGASSSIIPAGTALNGAVVNSKMILSNVTGSNAFDGGFITITNPDGTKLIVNSPSGTVVPCIGGTATTNGADTDHIGSATDCLPTLKIFPSQLRSYQVKCSDDGKNGDPPADGVLRWTFNYTGFSHRNALDNLSASALIQNELDCAFSLYTFTTDSNKKSTQTSPVSNLNDTVTITGVADLAGNFTTSAVLNPPTGADVTATCVTTPALNVIPLPLTVKCTVPGSYTAPGLYCWDVTVAETGVNYDSSSDKTQAGASDATHECFTVEQVVNACSPGYWKNDGAKFGAGDWKSPYHPGDSFATTFGVSEPSFISKTYVSGPRTLLDALNAQGPGSDFYRLAVDALLNAAYFNPPAVPGVVLAVQNHNVVALGFTENCTLNHSGK